MNEICIWKKKLFPINLIVKPKFTLGQIEFKNMSLYYDVNSTPSIKNLDFTIEPGSKVGIVGRYELGIIKSPVK